MEEQRVRHPARHRNGISGLAGLAVLAMLVSAYPRALSPSAASANTTAPDPPTTTLRAELLRSCELDFDTSGGVVQTPAERSSRVLLGLAAHACEDAARAVHLLSLEPAPEAELEDWRLFTLARAATETDDLPTANAAAELLLLDHRDSPLRHKSFVLHAQIAHLAGELDRALSMARASRAAPFPDALRTELDVLAWEVAAELGESVDIQREARQLLLHSPLEAIDLDVAEALVAASGEPDWSRHFEPWELTLRATRLVGLDLDDDALETLDAVAEADRDTSWRMTRARALIESKRGSEAYDLLAHVGGIDTASEPEVAWLRAEAALDAATARRGRQNLSASERNEMRRVARDHLREVARRGADSDLVVKALRRLFDELLEGENFEEVRTVLLRLRDIDGRDTTGSRYVWRLGWTAYTKRDCPTALSYWSELNELYPDSLLSRSGHYWSGRCHEAQGESERARAIFEEIAAAAATDYYRKHALIRLGRDGAEAVATTKVVPKSWPTDPTLARAARLSDLGLDDLGLEELEIVASPAARPAVDALRSRILARQGRRRESIQSLWRVFPMLGTPEQTLVPSDALRMYYPIDFLEIIERFAADNRLAVPLLLAMIRQESAFDVRARSWAGATGLMQVMPATAKELAQSMGLPYSRQRLSDPTFSVQLGSRYFRQILDMFDGNLELALAGYNAGPYRIRKLVRAAGPDLELDIFLESLRIEESKTYVKRIVLFSNSYEQLYPELG